MNKSDHFISLIIPVHNGGETLRTCLDSVFRSSYPCFECIVVDDRSSDNSLEVAKSYDTKIIQLDRKGGAARARNQGADVAQGDILLFIDSDVEIYSDSLDKVSKAFNEDPELSALFGSYDDQPGRTNFFSQYKNLFHHYIHQTSEENASTFWSGCGAIKKDVFFKLGKFNEGFKAASIEDIELGNRLKKRKGKIFLFKRLYVKHLKGYNFKSLLKSDFFDRAIPWTIQMLSNKEFVSDLNLKPHHRLSATLLVVLVISLIMTFKSKWFLIAVPIVFAGYFILNIDFYKFFFKKRGLIFTLKVIPFHLLYYYYSMLGFIVGICKYFFMKNFSKA